MRTFLFFLLWALCLAGPGVGQLHPFVPVGTEWWYEQDDWGPQPGGPLSNHVYIKAVGDTLINGIDTAVIVQAWEIQNTPTTPDTTIYSWVDRWYFATDSSEVYYWDGSQWRMWLDYTLSIGDTLFVEGHMPGYDFGQTGPYCGQVIDSVGSVTINGSVLPYFMFDGFGVPDTCNLTYQIAYGYVPHIGPIAYFPMLNSVADPAFGGDIRCINHPILGFQHLFGPSPCDYLAPVVGEAEAENLTSLQVFSTNGSLHFVTENINTEVVAHIFSLNGKELGTYKVQPGASEFENVLSPSVYLCVFKRNGLVVQTTRFIVF